MNQIKHGVQGLQAFAFCIVTVNDEDTKPRESLEVKLKDGLYTGRFDPQPPRC